MEVPLVEQQPQKSKQSSWQARRQRKQQRRRKEQEELQKQRFLRQQHRQKGLSQNYRASPSSPPSSKSNQNPDTPETVPDDELHDDPYESDPGESYRDHCERLEAESFPQTSRSCLTLPRFFTNHAKRKKAKPLPTKNLFFEGGSDDDDDRNFYYPDNLNPQSLPKDLQFLKYSDQSEIGDGSQPQDWSVETPSLRPNRTHLNMSHWSDFGKRDYMEDR